METTTVYGVGSVANYTHLRYEVCLVANIPDAFIKGLNLDRIELSCQLPRNEVYLSSKVGRSGLTSFSIRDVIKCGKQG